MTIHLITLRAFAFFFLVQANSCLSFAKEGDDEWKIGLAVTNVTPAEPVRMAGYASKERQQLSQGVASELFAKAMFLEDRDGNSGLLITTDVIGLTSQVAQPLYDRIIEETGLKREQILINSSHTHTGPALGLQDLEWFENQGQIETTIRYTKRLMDQLVEISVKAKSGAEPAKLSWGLGVATFVMNRREFTQRGVRLGVNPRGLVDRSVPVLRIQSADGTTRAVLIGTACHNTTLSGKDMLISGDFAGYAQQYVQKQIDGVQAMFMQGCGGDANPFPDGSEEVARVHGMTLGKEVIRVLESKLVPVSGPLTTLLSPIELPLQQTMTKDIYDKLGRASGATRNVATKLKEKLKTDGELPSTFLSRIGLWQFGVDLTLVALPGEVVVDYLKLIEEAIGPRKLWVSAYNHDVFGYLPSKRVLREGGYEMRGIYSGGIGIFAPEAEDVVVQKVQQLASEAGRE